MPEIVREAAGHIPAAAGIFARLQALVTNPNTPLHDIIDMVKLDAGLASSVVRAANSAFNRQSERIESVNDAINRIGLREVHRIVGHAVAGQLFVHHLSLYQIPARSVWENSLATAVAMSVLTRLLQEDERPAYTLGLLRPTGRLVLQRAAQSSKPAIEFVRTIGTGDDAENERAHFGITSTEVAAHLFAAWNLPARLVEAVRHHRKPKEARAADRLLAARLHLASWIAATLHKGLPAEALIWRNTAELSGMAGLPPEAIQACLVDIRSELNRLGAQMNGGCHS